MTRPITPETILAECATLEDAKAVARDMRQTAIAVGNKYGEGHPIARSFSDRYSDFVDAMAFWAQETAA
jgi:hypothetical protein